MKRGPLSFWLQLAGVAMLFALSAAPLSATEWRSVESAERCIGGERCGRFDTLRFPLDARPVEAIRFEAHDDVGTLHEGRIRVRIDDRIVVEALPVTRSTAPYRLNVPGVTGRTLVIETATDDEIVIRRIEVGYASRGSQRDDDRRYDGQRYDDRRYDDRRSRGSSGEATGLRLRGWESSVEGDRVAFIEEVGCVGGLRCRNSAITVSFRRSAPVGLIRFFAHDNVGQTARGRLRVLLDDQVLVEELDVPAAGRIFELSGRGQVARRLTFEPESSEEVLVKDLEVFRADDQYGRGAARPERAEQESSPGTWCLGGEACGRRWSLEIPVAGGVTAVRFFSRADVGRGFGRLKVVAGSEILGELNVDRLGDFYELEIPDHNGYLVMEATEGDLVLEEVELKVGDAWERYRGDDPR